MPTITQLPSATHTHDEMQRIFDRYHDAWEAKDPDAIVALHSEDSSFMLRGGEERIVGRAALRDHFAGIFGRFVDYQAETQRLILGDAHWVLEWTMVLDLTDPDGDPFVARIDLLDVIDVDADGFVTRKDVYVDGAQQLDAYRRAGWL